jgi:hypothetical protein
MPKNQQPDDSGESSSQVFKSGIKLPQGALRAQKLCGISRDDDAIKRFQEALHAACY